MERLQELQKLQNELFDVLEVYEKEVEATIQSFFEKLTTFKIRAVSCFTDWDKGLSIRVTLLDNDGKDIFGTDFSIRYEEKLDYRTELPTPTSGKLSLNVGTCGSYTRLDDNGAFVELAMLIGKVWEHEKELDAIYHNIDWTNSIKFREYQREIDAIKQKQISEEWERKQAQEKQELDEILSELKVGTVVEDNVYGNWHETVTIERISNHFIFLSRHNNKYGWQKRFDKYEFAKKIRKERLAQ